MNIPKAIETLSDEVTYLEPEYGPDFINAIKLGIEALKVVQSNRVYGYPNKIPELPGETKD